MRGFAAIQDFHQHCEILRNQTKKEGHVEKNASEDRRSHCKEYPKQ